VKIATTRFGTLEEVEVSESQMIRFPSGIIGFRDHVSFAILTVDVPKPFAVLQSFIDFRTAFLAVDLRSFWTTGCPPLPPHDEEALQLRNEEPLWLGLVTLRGPLEDAAINTLAPIVINRKRRLGRQIILHEGSGSVAEPLFKRTDTIRPPSAANAR
jgi:flagellar assembly factor FliW